MEVEKFVPAGKTLECTVKVLNVESHAPAPPAGVTLNGVHVKEPRLSTDHSEVNFNISYRSGDCSTVGSRNRIKRSSVAAADMLLLVGHSKLSLVGAA